MQKKDHLQLAKYLLQNRQSGIPVLCQLAFLYGNIEPDINYLTYLHGFWKYDKFHGHHYENVRPVIDRLLQKLSRRMDPVRKVGSMGEMVSVGKTDAMGLLDYFRLGKCMHYTADIFTFPHNKEFTGTIKEHCQYEEVLHEHLSAIIGENSALEFPGVSEETEENVTDKLQMLHEHYLDEKEKFGCVHDVAYILTAAQLLANEFLVPVLQPSYSFLSYTQNYLR